MTNRQHKIHFGIPVRYLTFVLCNLLLVPIIFSCRQVNKNESVDDDYIFDTIITQSARYDHFQFEILQISNPSFSTAYHCYINRENSKQSFFLFETTDEYKDGLLQHLYGEYYAFPYFTGGNYCRAMGINIIKATGDTAFFIGPVSGYDVIDASGDKKLFIHVATDLSGSQAEHKTEQLEVFLVNDSLKYNGIDLY
jgi:hypothetical protein